MFNVTDHVTDLGKTDTDVREGHLMPGKGQGHTRGHGVTEVGHGSAAVTIEIVNLVLIGT